MIQSWALHWQVTSDVSRIAFETVHHVYQSAVRNLQNSVAAYSGSSCWWQLGLDYLKYHCGGLYSQSRIRSSQILKFTARRAQIGVLTIHQDTFASNRWSPWLAHRYWTPPSTWWPADTYTTGSITNGSPTTTTQTSYTSTWVENQKHRRVRTNDLVPELIEKSLSNEPWPHKTNHKNNSGPLEPQRSATKRFRQILLKHNETKT